MRVCVEVATPHSQHTLTCICIYTSNVTETEINNFYNMHLKRDQFSQYTKDQKLKKDFIAINCRCSIIKILTSNKRVIKARV